MTKLIETTLFITILLGGLFSMTYLAKHSAKAKTGIERHLLGK